MYFPIFLFLLSSSTISTLPSLTLADSCPSSVRETILHEHNYYRGVHGVPPLTLDGKLNSFAQQWSDKLRHENLFEHRPNNVYGENIFWHTGGYERAALSIKWFYAEMKYYTFGSEPDANFHKWAHFTQLVWKDSRRIGVGCTVGQGKVTVVVNYEPAGNVVGHFAQQVLPPIA